MEDQNVPLDRLTFLQGTPFPPLCPLFSFSPGEEKKEDKEKEEEEEEEEERTIGQFLIFLQWAEASEVISIGPIRGDDYFLKRETIVRGIVGRHDRY